MMRWIGLLLAFVAVGAKAGEITPATVGNLAPAWIAQLPAPSKSNPVADGKSLYVTVTTAC